jgi:3-keto-L-gulonate-6-phosphate decarboxylase
MLIFRDDNKVASVKFFPRISMDNVIVGSQIFAKRDSENNSKQIYEIMNL